MRRALVLLIGVVLVLVGLTPAALADPKTEPLWIECVGVPSAWITANGNGAWTPAHDNDGTGVYLPYAFQFDVYFTPDGGVEGLVESDYVSKRAPKNAQSHAHGVCTFGEEFEVVDDPFFGTGTGRFVGMAWVFYSG